MQAQERTEPPLVCGRRLERTQRREKERTGARKKGRARGNRVCPVFSLAHITLLQESLLFIAPATQAMPVGREARANSV